MTQPIEIKVPDIGDFHDVSVIEVLVKPGDTVEKETPLITLETDKATMEVPSPMAGVVKEVNVKVNDKVSEGSLILKLEPPPPPLKPLGLLMSQARLLRQPKTALTLRHQKKDWNPQVTAAATDS